MTLPNNKPPVDIFASESRPSISFKDKPHGTTVVFAVESYPELVQSRDYETGKPATWPDGNPKMSAVINGKVNGVDVSLWAAKPSALFSALATASRTAGAQIAPGGTLTITYTHDEPNKTNPRLNPAKQFTASYTPGNAFAETPQQAVVNAPAQQVVAEAAKTLSPEQYAALAAAGVDMSAFTVGV